MIGASVKNKIVSLDEFWECYHQERLLIHLQNYRTSLPIFTSLFQMWGWSASTPEKGKKNKESAPLYRHFILNSLFSALPLLLLFRQCSWNPLSMKFDVENRSKSICVCVCVLASILDIHSWRCYRMYANTCRFVFVSLFYAHELQLSESFFFNNGKKN